MKRFFCMKVKEKCTQPDKICVWHGTPINMYVSFFSFLQHEANNFKIQQVRFIRGCSSRIQGRGTLQYLFVVFCCWMTVVGWTKPLIYMFFFVNFLSLVRNCLLFWSSCALPWHMIIVFLFSVYFVEGFDHLKKDTKGVKIWGKNAIYHIKRKIYLSHKKLCNLFRQCLVPKKIDGKCKGKKIEKKKWRKILGYVWFLENLKENAKERKYKGKVEGK